MTVKTQTALDVIFPVRNVNQRNVAHRAGTIGDGVMTMLMYIMKVLLCVNDADLCSRTESRDSPHSHPKTGSKQWGY